MYIYIYMYVCVYIYIYIYMYTHKHTHTYGFLPKSDELVQGINTYAHTDTNTSQLSLFSMS